jgi:hypothetical protein
MNPVIVVESGVLDDPWHYYDLQVAVKPQNASMGTQEMKIARKKQSKAYKGTKKTKSQRRNNSDPNSPRKVPAIVTPTVASPNESLASNTRNTEPDGRYFFFHMVSVVQVPFIHACVQHM